MAAGKFAASATPSAARAAANASTDTPVAPNTFLPNVRCASGGRYATSPWAAAAALQSSTASRYPRLTPIRSMTPPTASRPAAYAAWNATTMFP